MSTVAMALFLAEETWHIESRWTLGRFYTHDRGTGQIDTVNSSGSAAAGQRQQRAVAIVAARRLVRSVFGCRRNPTWPPGMLPSSKTTHTHSPPEAISRIGVFFSAGDVVDALRLVTPVGR